MTRQRLREGSIKWETNLSLESFSQKIIKKLKLLLLLTVKLKQLMYQLLTKFNSISTKLLKKKFNISKKNIAIRSIF